MDALTFELSTGARMVRGLWCPTCLLPTAFEADVVVLSEDGVSTLGTFRGCEDSDDPTHYPSPASQGA
jgi:hypothetical protein